MALHGHEWSTCAFKSHQPWMFSTDANPSSFLCFFSRGKIHLRPEHRIYEYFLCITAGYCWLRDGAEKTELFLRAEKQLLSNMSYCTTELIHVLHKSFIFAWLLEICIQGIIFITTDAQFASNHVSWPFPPLPFPQSHGHSVFLITTQSQTLSTSPEHQELNLLCRTSIKIY